VRPVARPFPVRCKSAAAHLGTAGTVLDGDEQYHRNEEGTNIQVFRMTVNDLLVDDELETGDLVKLTITNLNDGSSASIVRTVQLA
jgi:hypothetical protein